MSSMSDPDKHRPSVRQRRFSVVPRALRQWDAARRMPRPHSLRVQLALGSALVALIAVALVATISLFTVTLTFNAFERNQLAGEVARFATTLGQAASPGFQPVSQGTTLGQIPNDPRTNGVTIVWVMDTSGHLLVAPAVNTHDPTAARDANTVIEALRQALRGQTTEDALPGGHWMSLTGRLYAATPVYYGGDSRNQIVGAVGLSSPARADRAALFAAGVSRMMLIVALGVAVLAAAAAWFFSRWLTRPLAGVAMATARMAEGDYATRVAPRGPEELQVLGRSFNEMAATLERDVGELRRQEQFRRELVANVSHELATPLTAIQGFTEALLDGVVTGEEERTETIRVVAREAARLRRLVDQLRGVSLYEGGAHTLDRAPVALPALVEETLKVLEPERERKRLVMRNQLPADLPLVYADADRLTEILLNLLDNAVRHTPEGGRIEVSGAHDGALVRIHIADTGPGIGPEDRQRIFERFYRVDASRSSATGGTGLGLAIVRALVEAHGGTIEVDGQPGAGTTLTFTLPVAQPGATPPAAGTDEHADQPAPHPALP